MLMSPSLVFWGSFCELHFCSFYFFFSSLWEHLCFQVSYSFHPFISIFDPVLLVFSPVQSSERLEVFKIISRGETIQTVCQCKATSTTKLQEGERKAERKTSCKPVGLGNSRLFFFGFRERSSASFKSFALLVSFKHFFLPR